MQAAQPRSSAAGTAGTLQHTRGTHGRAQLKSLSPNPRAQTPELGPEGGLHADLRGQVTLWQRLWVCSAFRLGNGMGLRWHLGQGPSKQTPCRSLQNPAHCVSPVN